MDPDTPLVPTTPQLRRLRQLWRSAGWPCQDMLELELLASGWLERLRDDHGRETLRLTDSGITVLHAGFQKNRALRDRHEALVERAAVELQRAGRVVWRGLTLRAGLPREDEPARMRWVNAMPDLYSVRNTTVEDYLEPTVHEIKVSRADLLGELRKPAKAQAYLALSSQCWYVLKAGIAEPQRSRSRSVCCWRMSPAPTAGRSSWSWRVRPRGALSGRTLAPGWRSRRPPPVPCRWTTARTGSDALRRRLRGQPFFSSPSQTALSDASACLAQTPSSWVRRRLRLASCCPLAFQAVSWLPTFCSDRALRS